MRTGLDGVEDRRGERPHEDDGVLLRLGDSQPQEGQRYPGHRWERAQQGEQRVEDGLHEPRRTQENSQRDGYPGCCRKTNQHPASRRDDVHPELALLQEDDCSADDGRWRGQEQRFDQTYPADELPGRNEQHERYRAHKAQVHAPTAARWKAAPVHLGLDAQVLRLLPTLAVLGSLQRAW